MHVGGIEAGGTSWVCAISDGRDGLERIETIPTTTPEETIARALEFFADGRRMDALGIGTFGPVDLRPASPGWGRITTTPKPGWAQTDVVSTLRDALDVPVALDTDVNAAALGEWRWGAAVGLETFCYVTVGTGIGGGALANGRPLHGLLHPEFGHIRIPHDRTRDPFPGACPFHGDCFEGLASGEALRQRWGRAGERLTEPAVWELEAEYLALGLLNVVFILSPERIVLGGGVSRAPGLLPLVRARLRELIAGYLDAPQLWDEIDHFLVPPALGSRAGVVGAIELARLAVSESS
jgi:fructokinase